MTSATTKNLHVPMPALLYRQLRHAAEKQGRPATQVAREAIALWLVHEQKRSTEDQLRRYVQQTAGSSDDLDPALEAASVEHLTGRRAR